jgi:hypothetical protein
MDADAMLDRLRQALSDLLMHQGFDDPEEQGRLVREVERAFDSLDEYLSTGGPLPEAWARLAA